MTWVSGGPDTIYSVDVYELKNRISPIKKHGELRVYFSVLIKFIIKKYLTKNKLYI